MQDIISTAEYGHRIITCLIDEVAEKDPGRLFAVVCSYDNPGLVSRDVTYKDFARAINRAAWWLEKTLGGKGFDFPTIGYMGPNDIRYIIFGIAANKACYKVLFPSPRNSVAYHIHVLEESKCTLMLRDEQTDIKNIQHENRDLQDIVVPSIDELLSKDEVEAYPYMGSATSIKEPMIVLHSSGSTGPPKVIIWTQESLCKLDAHHMLSLEGKHSLMKGIYEPRSLLFNSFPLFHAVGLIFSLGYSCYYDLPNIFPPTGQVNVSTILDTIDMLDPKLLGVATSVLEELSSNQKSLAKLQGRSLFFGGSPLADSAGEILMKHASLCCLIGTTESGEFPLFTHEAIDWNYCHFPPHLKGLIFRKYDDSLFELVFVRDEETDRYHSIWITFPDLEEYSTKDLYSKHPDKPDLWRHRGRSDDTIALSNGEKFVPIPYEMRLKEAKEVRDALLIGQGQFDVSVLIELDAKYSKLSHKEALMNIVPLLRDINLDMPRFARISPDRVLFVKAEKPMVRAGKGSVIRKATLTLYEKEITDLYEEVTELNPGQLPLVRNVDLHTTTESLKNIFAHVSDLDENCVEDNNVFMLGFDSLNVMTAVRHIKAILQAEGISSINSITPALIYSNPTIDELTKAIRSLDSPVPDKVSLEKARIQEMEHMLGKYSKDIKEMKLDQVQQQSSGLNVVLTGSTGSLGSYLLDSLVQSDKIATIFALNRSDNGKERQRKACSIRKLETSFEKVKFIQVDLGDKEMGTSAENYESIRTSAHLIIHNQWAVDFNLSLKSMEPHVAGVRQLIDLSLSATFHPYIIFTSSVGTLGSYAKLHPEEPAAPEAIFEDPAIPQPLGYTMAKQISERLLNIASQRTGLRTSSAKLGQIAGPVQRLGGVWNKQEWLPSIVISSAYLKALPADLHGAVDWLPVDVLADIIVEIALHDIGQNAELPKNKTMVYNLINPEPVGWPDLTSIVLENLPSGTETVSLSDWVEVLRKSAENQQVDTVRNPAVKLLDFFEKLANGGEISAKMQVANAKKISASFRNVQAVNSEWMRSWMKGWGLTQSS